MEKRLPLALFLSFLVLFGWSILFQDPPAEPTPGQPGAPPPEGIAGVAPGSEPAAPGPASTGEASPELSGPQATVFDTQERELSFLVGAPGDPAETETPGHYRVVFSNRGARLKQLLFGGYYRRVGLDQAERSDEVNWLPLLEPITTLGEVERGSLLLTTSASSQDLAPHGLDQALWTMEELTDSRGRRNGVEFRYGPGTGVVFTKRVTFEPGTWHLLVKIGIENVGEEPSRSAQFNLIPAGCVPPELGDNFYREPRATAVQSGAESAEWEAAPGADAVGPLASGGAGIVCAGVHNKYFAFLIRDAGLPTMTGARFVARQELAREEARELIETEIQITYPLPGPGETKSWNYVVYAGPKAPGVFAADDPAHQLVLDSDLDAGFCGLNFTLIGHALLAVLRALHRVVGNWGTAIILLTFAVRLVLFPLNRRSQTAMARYAKKMKRVQPQIDELKKKYENDPQKQREAQAKVMQEEGAFPPLGGCLPMFLQLPIFFGLFSMLRTSFDLRQQPFYGWINDLARPDRMAELGFDLPLIGTVEYFNLLPILMVIMWILQQKGMPQPTDEQAARMQKMMMFMPVVFGFMLYNYAAGLSLYMMTTSTLGIFEQKVIKKVWPIDDTELETKKKKGCGPFSGMMQQMAEKQKAQMKKMEAMKAAQRKQGGKRKKR